MIYKEWMILFHGDGIDSCKLSRKGTIVTSGMREDRYWEVLIKVICDTMRAKLMGLRIINSNAIRNVQEVWEVNMLIRDSTIQELEWICLCFALGWGLVSHARWDKKEKMVDERHKEVQKASTSKGTESPMNDATHNESENESSSGSEDPNSGGFTDKHTDNLKERMMCQSLMRENSIHFASTKNVIGRRQEIDIIHEEFQTLTQTNETVNEMWKKFNDLLRYCPEDHGNEKLKVERFQRMLRDDIREVISLFKCTTLDDLSLSIKERAHGRDLRRVASRIGHKSNECPNPKAIEAKSLKSIKEEKVEKTGIPTLMARAYMMATKEDKVVRDVVIGAFDIVIGMDWLDRPKRNMNLSYGRILGNFKAKRKIVCPRLRSYAHEVGLNCLMLQDNYKKARRELTELMNLNSLRERNYWWPGMKRDCAKYVERCLTCLKVKAEHQKLYGKIQPLEIPVWKWEKITMDFVTKLPRTTKKHDAIWVIVDRLTKSAHFIPIREKMPVHKLAKIYVHEIVARHGVPVSIVSDRDGRFTSNFWRDFQEELRTRLHMSTTFHPQTDGQSERTIQTLEDMLRACVIDFGENWDDQLPLVEFAYNNSYHASINMPPYEMLYGRKCRTPLCWDEVGSRESASTDVVLATTEKIETIRERIKEAQDKWKSYANKKRRPIEFNVGDFVMLKVSPWKGVMRFKNKGKLSPRFIGPFKILKRVGEVAYSFELPEEMRELTDYYRCSVSWHQYGVSNNEYGVLENVSSLETENRSSIQSKASPRLIHSKP
ncbi:putative reverse transcriptase domain-containing protein [Tanacetum coccineum]